MWMNSFLIPMALMFVLPGRSIQAGGWELGRSRR